MKNVRVDKLITTENTQYQKDLNLPRFRLKTGQRSFAFRGATCWNKLPKDMKEVADCRIFKRLIRSIKRGLTVELLACLLATASGNIASMSDPLDGSLWWYWIAANAAKKNGACF